MLTGLIPGFVIVIRDHVMMVVMDGNFPAVSIRPVVMMVVMNHIGSGITIDPADVILILTTIIGLSL